MRSLRSLGGSLLLLFVSLGLLGSTPSRADAYYYNWSGGYYYPYYWNTGYYNPYSAYSLYRYGYGNYGAYYNRYPYYSWYRGYPWGWYY